MSIPVYPLRWAEGWPRPQAAWRRTAQFGKTAWKSAGNGGGSRGKTYRGKTDRGKTDRGKTDLAMADAMTRVKAEPARLGVNVTDDAIVSTNPRLNPAGPPRGGQGEPSDPGVAVCFQKNNGPMRVIAVDASRRVRDNLAAIAAIAATPGAMRLIARRGGAQHLARASTCFDAWPPPVKCWDIRETRSGASVEVIAANLRRLARDRHPDRFGGNAAMAQLDEARAAGLAARR
jgi:hypothetical protein